MPHLVNAPPRKSVTDDFINGAAIFTKDLKHDLEIGVQDLNHLFGFWICRAWRLAGLSSHRKNEICAAKREA